MPPAFSLAMLRVAQAGPAERFADGVRDAIREGGCNASRAGLVGACLGAQGGAAAVPAAWLRRTRRGAEVLRLAVAVAAARGGA